MIEFTNKTIYFSGRGEKIDKEELYKFIIQNGGNIIESLNDADIIIQGYMTPVHLEDQYYLLSKEGKTLITIEELEKHFSKELDIDSILMALKISKEKQRVIKLLKNSYFNDDIFIKILKYYNWENIGIYDSDDNRDVATAITNRFCSLVESNHNIQHSPIGIYYTALETTSPQLLEAIYNMPKYKISDKNAFEDQPLTLKEVIALNPNTPLTVLIQILKNNNENELLFLAQNNSINKMIQKKLFETKNTKILKNLIRSNNIDKDYIDTILSNNELKKELLKSIELSADTFQKILDSDMNDTDFVYLSSNPFLQSEQIAILFTKNIPNVNINLLKNIHCPNTLIDNFIKQKDKIYNIAIASNKNLDSSFYQILEEYNDLDIDIAIAFNTNTPKPILTKLYQKNNENINTALSVNISTPINILMQLQIDSRYQANVLNNETYKEFAKNSLGIISDRNSSFKRNTYLDTV